jgi:hypothetical protein
MQQKRNRCYFFSAPVLRRHPSVSLLENGREKGEADELLPSTFML